MKKILRTYYMCLLGIKVRNTHPKVVVQLVYMEKCLVGLPAISLSDLEFQCGEFGSVNTVSDDRLDHEFLLVMLCDYQGCEYA